MTLRITHRRMSPGGARNELIIDVNWQGDAGEGNGAATRAQMVDYIDNRNFWHTCRDRCLDQKWAQCTSPE